MPSYPTYRQNWDGGAGTYSEWNNLSGNFSVGTPSLVSASDALQIAQNATYGNITKNAAEASADGKLTVYHKFSNESNPGFGLRVQGASTSDGDVNAYFIYFYGSSGSSDYHMQLYRYSTTPASGNVVALFYTTFDFTHRYMVEFRISGTSLKIRVRDLDNSPNFWMQTNGTWSTAAADAISATDSTVTAAGRLSISSYSALSGRTVDDVFWDPPDPILSQSTASLTAGGSTVTLTAGGFSDPISGVTWGSSNTGVATVSGGVVTPVGAGTATITATGASDTGQTATCAVTVSAATGGPFPWFTIPFCDYNFAQK